jgi:hypothetical protein
MASSDQKAGLRTRKGEQEAKEIAAQVIAAGNKFAPMAKRVKDIKATRADLVRVVIKYCKTRGITTLPLRTQKRHQRGMICWICEHAPEFPAGFDHLLASLDNPDQSDQINPTEGDEEEVPPFNEDEASQDLPPLEDFFSDIAEWLDF